MQLFGNSCPDYGQTWNRERQTCNFGIRNGRNMARVRTLHTNLCHTSNRPYSLGQIQILVYRIICFYFPFTFLFVFNIFYCLLFVLMNFGIQLWDSMRSKRLQTQFFNIQEHVPKFRAVNAEELMFYYFGRCLYVMEDRGHLISLEHLKFVPNYFMTNAIVDTIPYNSHSWLCQNCIRIINIYFITFMVCVLLGHSLK